ncbi:hypothetical protein [Roseateles paludis]|uniref:DUF2975 domain-containing protein n=1 Tax=Roseateles paludis TaxID=3145238 RepID=A0ABV0G0K3_9BURK
MPEEFSPSGLRRIRRLAFWVRLMCVVGALAVVFLPFVFWAQADWVAQVLRDEWRLPLVQMDLASRLGGLAASLIPAGFIVYVCWHMWALFGCFAEGELLARTPAEHLRRLGLGLTLLAAAQPISQTLVVLAVTLGNPPGERRLWFGLSSTHYLVLLFGLLLLALAQVLLEGSRVAEENREFI